MKAAKLKDIADLERHLPMLATPKWDGIRAFTFEPVIMEMFGPACAVYSNTLTKIPNNYVQKKLSEYNIKGLDGELITYTDGKMDPYNTVQEKIMSRSGEPDFKYHVFDLVAKVPYWERMRQLKDEMDFPKSCKLVKCLPILLKTIEQVVDYEERMLLEGFEGVMLRSIDGPYKFGRSTEREGHLFKMKRFLDAEATIIGFEELMHNENEATKDSFGLTERSSHKVNKTHGDTLGALIVNGHNNVQFKIGSGFTQEQRDMIWKSKDEMLFQQVKYKYQPHGVKDKPRCPIFLGFRPSLDITKAE